MAHRIEVSSTIPDTRAAVRRKKLQQLGFPVQQVLMSDVYTVDADVPPERVAQLLVHPVTQQEGTPLGDYDWAVEVGFLPGVTDNIATTTRETIEDALTAWYLNINVRSNGVVLVNGGRALSVGTGQQERIRAVEMALDLAAEKGHNAELRGAVLSSDAFFPSRDCIDEVAKYGVGAVMWPAGSLGDADIIDAANEHEIALIAPTTGERCFAHF